MKFYKLLNRYIFSSFSGLLINIGLIFFALVMILNLFEEINFFKDHDVNFYLPLKMAALKTPSIIFKIFPFIFLVCSMVLFLKLIYSDEINSIRICGISNVRIILFPSFIALLFGVFIVLVFNMASAKSTLNYLQIKNEYNNNRNYLASLTNDGIWIKDKVNKKDFIIRAEKLENKLLKNITIYALDAKINEVSRIDSESANIENKKFILKNNIIYKKNNENILEKIKNYNFKSNINFNVLNDFFSDLSTISFWDLNKIKNNYERIGYSTRDIISQIHKAIAFPFFLMSMVILSGIIALNIKFKGGYIYYIILAIMLSVIINYMNDFSIALGETEEIPLILSIWMPVILIYLTSGIGLIYINNK